jgi:hypothetical protein
VSPAVAEFAAGVAAQPGTPQSGPAQSLPAQSAAAAASTRQAGFPPVQPIDLPSAAPQPAPSIEQAAKKTARQAQIAAAREAKRKQRATRPVPYSIREFFAWRR